MFSMCFLEEFSTWRGVWWYSAEKWHVVKETFIFANIFCNWRDHFRSSWGLKLSTKQPIHIKITFNKRGRFCEGANVAYIDFLKRNTFETALSERKCSIFDLIRFIDFIGWKRKVSFSRNKNIFEG